MRRRRLLLAAAFVSVIVLLTYFVLLPYIFRPEYHAVDITWEYRNKPALGFTTNFGAVRDFVPSKLAMADTDPAYVIFSLGLLHVEIEGKSYDAVYLMIGTRDLPLESIKVPDIFNAIDRQYVLGFFTNNSELGEVLRSYGFPLHTC